jgi:hypothetical protein
LSRADGARDFAGVDFQSIVSTVDALRPSFGRVMLGLAK